MPTNTAPGPGVVQVLVTIYPTPETKGTVPCVGLAEVVARLKEGTGQPGA